MTKKCEACLLKSYLIKGLNAEFSLSIYEQIDSQKKFGQHFTNRQFLLNLIHLIL